MKVLLAGLVLASALNAAQCAELQAAANALIGAHFKRVVEVLGPPDDFSATQYTYRTDACEIRLAFDPMDHTVSRLLDEDSNPEIDELRDQIAALSSRVSTLEAGVELAEKRNEAATRRLAALATQSRGLDAQSQEVIVEVLRLLAGGLLGR